MNREQSEFLEKKCDACKNVDVFQPDFYVRYDVKKGLRDSDGRGVVVGLTNVSQVDGS